MPSGASPAALSPQTGARPEATLLASEAAGAREAAQGDTFNHGNTTFNQTFHNATDSRAIMTEIRKAVRNGHPLALAALGRRR